MKKIALASRTSLILASLATITIACSQTEPENIPVPQKDASARVNSNGPSADLSEETKELLRQAIDKRLNTVKFVEAAPVDIKYSVPGSDSRLELKRAASSSYDVTFVTARGERRVLATPTQDRPLNPIVDSRSYGATNITCANSFANPSGSKPLLRCFLLETDTGNILDSITVDDVWLRATAEAGRAVFVSPHVPVHADPGHIMSCRGIYVDDNNRLVYDDATILPCSDKESTGVTVPEVRERINREAAQEIQRVNGANAAPPPTAISKVFLLDPSGGDPSGGDPSGGNPSGGNPSGGDDPPDPNLDMVKCTNFPTSRLEKRALGPSENPRLNNLIQSVLEELSVGWTGVMSDGRTFGYNVTLQPDNWQETDAPMCLWDRTNIDLNGEVTVSLGPVEVHGALRYIDKTEKCAPLECNVESGQYFCNTDKNGHSWQNKFGIRGSGDGVLPLQTAHPIFKAICIDMPGGKWGKIVPKRTCQVQVGLVYNHEENLDYKNGQGACGSSCANGALTKFEQKTDGYGGQLTAEFEFSFGLFGSGRIGIAHSTTYTKISTTDIGCNRREEYNDRCLKHRTSWYGNLSIGGFYDFGHFDEDISYWASPDCPVETAKPGRPSWGTMVGGKCKSDAGSSWGWSSLETRCKACCDKQKNEGAFIVLLPGQTEDGMLGDCYAACESRGRD